MEFNWLSQFPILFSFLVFLASAAAKPRISSWDTPDGIPDLLKPLDVRRRSRKKIAEFKERLRNDIGFFADFYFDVELEAKQLEFANSCLNNRHSVAVFSRQSGKTTVIAILIVYVLCYWKDVVIQCYAPTEKQVKGVIFARVKQLFESQPLLYARIPKGNLKACGEIMMDNGNIFQVQTANADSNIRGYSPTIIILDESQDIPDQKHEADIAGSGAALKNITASLRRYIRKNFHPDQYLEEIQKAGIKTLIWECGTAKGRSHFHEITLPGTKAYVVKQTWKECTFIDLEYIARKKRELLPRTFAAEFECVFDITEGYAFDRDLVEKASAGNTERNYKPWERGEYYCGIDLGRQVDHTSVTIMERIGPVRRMVYHYVFPTKLPWHEIIDPIYDILREWQPLLTLMDCTGPTGKAYHMWFSDMDDVDGMEYKPREKSELMRHTQILFQRELIEIWDDESLLMEFWKAEEEQNPGSSYPKFPKPKGGNDDQVQSVALACMAAFDDTGGVDFYDEDDDLILIATEVESIKTQTLPGSLHPSALLPSLKRSPRQEDDDGPIVLTPDSGWRSIADSGKFGERYYRPL